MVTTVDMLSSINLDGGDNSIHNDFAETRPADLSGYVYHDANNNGIMDPGEEGIGGVQLTLLDAAGNPTGRRHYRRRRLLSVRRFDARHVRRGRGPAGRIPGRAGRGRHAGGTAHNPGDLIDGVHLVGGQSGLDYDFGELLPASISGYVYVDANNNGMFDAGETPIGGVQLTLLDAAGNPTGSDGHHRRHGLLSLLTA